MEFKLNTPIAFLVFNRPETTRLVFEEIRIAKPAKLLLVIDGPRMDRDGEAEKCEAVRRILDTIDWPCEVLKNYSEINLGCKKRISSGIDWVFEQVEEAIILEDDCLPHPSFFRFCEELLHKYRDDERVGMISGDNFQFGLKRNSDSYYFSKYNHVWGWASWRNRWKGCYDVEMMNWPMIRDEGWLYDMLGSKQEANRWTNTFDSVHQGKVDTWDFQWTFACWLHGRLTVIPNLNLVSNIGFGEEATHTTKENKFANIQTERMNFPLKHPVGVIVNREMDNLVFKSVFEIPLIIRLRQYLSRLLKGKNV